MTEETARESKQTEKGVQWQADVKRKEFRASLTIWRRAANKLRTLLADEVEISDVRLHRDTSQQAMDRAIEAQETLSAFLHASSLEDDSAERLEDAEVEHAALMKQTHERLLELRGSSSSAISVKSRLSKTATSQKLSDCQKWVNNTSNLPSHEEGPSVENEHPDLTNHEPNWPDPAVENASKSVAEEIPTVRPAEETGFTSSSTQQVQAQTGDALSSLAGSLLEHLKMNRLPPPEPIVFSGDPLQFVTWKQGYEILIEHRGVQVPPAERFFYLKKYLKGEALDLVRGFALINDEASYMEAKRALDKRFGDPFIISNAFRNKLDSWPNIPPKDAFGLRRLSDFLRQCQTAMEKNGNLNHLNDERENRRILAKLPEWLIVRWGRTVADYKEKQGTYPPFRTFAAFVEKEANIACDPVTSLNSLKGDRQNQKGMSLTGARSLSTNVSPSPKLQNGDKAPSRPCLLCTKLHGLDRCEMFASKSLPERRLFVKDKGLCFGCLRPGHRSKDCRRRSTCAVCKKRHPTTLHGDTGGNQTKETSTHPDSRQEDHASVSSHTTVCHFSANKDITRSTMIVPVWLSHHSKPEERMVYALLDTQSDTTFLLESTKCAMGLKGVEVNLLLSTMTSQDERVPSERIEGLAVRAHNSGLKIPLPATYTRSIMPANRGHIPNPDMASSHAHLTMLREHLLPVQPCEIGLLIGYDCTRALAPREVIPPISEGPYGLKTDLGWSIVGVINRDVYESNADDKIGISHRVTTCELPSELRCDGTARNHVVFAQGIRTKEELSPTLVTRLLEADFSEAREEASPLSRNDVQFLRTMESSIHVTEDGHYEMPLPFKESEPKLPNNKFLASKRLENLQRRFERDESYRKKYSELMDALIANGYAEPVPDSTKDKEGSTWYIPHHGVQQPNKLRIVFDCSAQFKGYSLNSHLLTGPDLTNKLVGVLCRFREENIAFMCDVKEMFHQFRVNINHRDYLRFLWWPSGNYSQGPREFRMRVHLFGAASSPGCSNFALKQLAKDHAVEFGSEVVNFILHDFYVDDGLKSVPSTKEAISMISETRQLCQKGGLHLHKFVSNSREVLNAVPADDRAKGVREINLLHDDLPMERALGVQWCIESDSFKFRITLHDKPLTRRGVLSTVMSVYDPLGLLAPVVLVGKMILQELCRESAKWDDPLPEELRLRWERWRNDILNLESLSIKRCYQPADFGEIQTAQLHSFSDASTCGYGQCSYLRLRNSEGKVHCSLVIGKSRVAPLKSVTIPRLELTAAVVSVKVSSLLCRELDFNCEEFFWTDSSVVLGYVNNDMKRFHVFVANRVGQIRDKSSPSQWRHIDTKDNPADAASRGLTVNQLIETSSWLSGPTMLWREDLPSCEDQASFNVKPDDPELKKSRAHTTCTKLPGLELSRLDRFSSWHNAKRAVANCRRFISHLKRRVREKHQPQNVDPVLRPPELEGLTAEDLHLAEVEILKQLQRKAFADEIAVLQSLSSGEQSERQTRRQVKKVSCLHRLDPFLDDNRVLRVGGRIRRADESFMSKHPAILPQKHHITKLVINHYHQQTAHQGRGMTLNLLRASGFWIVGGSSAVSRYIRECVTCRRLRGSTQTQKMADLPSDRVTPAPPFTYCGMDCFGPFVIKEGRKELKRYGLLFTCMASRAVHIETLNSMSTDAFINGLRRFVALRGPVRQLRSDRGTNFVGSETEFKKAWAEIDHQMVGNFLLKQGCDYTEFNFNVPSASHMGGAWERLIRSTRTILQTLMYQSGQQLDDESLRTFLCEATAIINSRPLTVDPLSDPTDPAPLTPNHLLTMKSRILLPPPGNFQREDLYSTKRWRRVQHLTNEFWSRWRKEFLQSLQARQKWTHPQRESSVGDVVIIKDEETPRNHWLLARVEEVYPSEDKHVRKVKLLIGDSQLSNLGKRVKPLKYLERPIHKLVLLLPAEP